MSEDSEPKAITLPDAEEMLRRLRSVNDARHTEEHLFPQLLWHAESELHGKGIAALIQWAIGEYVQTLSPPMASIMRVQVPSFIEALVDDEEVRRDALHFLAEVEAAKRRR